MIQIWEYVSSLYRDIPLTVYEGILSVLCLGVVLIIALYGVMRGWRKIAGLVLAEYVFLIYCSTVIFRTYSEFRGHDFTPFWSYVAIYEGKVQYLPENIMNGLVFVPLGILLGCTFMRLTWWKALLVGCCLSMTIEAIQYIFQRGFSEVDDVIHNTLGCVIGYGLFNAIKMFVKTNVANSFHKE